MAKKFIAGPFITGILNQVIALTEVQANTYDVLDNFEEDFPPYDSEANNSKVDETIDAARDALLGIVTDYAKYTLVMGRNNDKDEIIL